MLVKLFVYIILILSPAWLCSQVVISEIVNTNDNIIESADLSPNGQLISTVSDGTLYLWEIKDSIRPFFIDSLSVDSDLKKVLELRFLSNDFIQLTLKDSLNNSQSQVNTELHFFEISESNINYLDSVLSRERSIENSFLSKAIYLENQNRFIISTVNEDSVSVASYIKMGQILIKDKTITEFEQRFGNFNLSVSQDKMTLMMVYLVGNNTKVDIYRIPSGDQDWVLDNDLL